MNHSCFQTLVPSCMSLRCLRCGALSPGLANLSLTIYTLLTAPRYDIVLAFLHGSDCQPKSWLARLISFTVFLRVSRRILRGHHFHDHIMWISAVFLNSFYFLDHWSSNSNIPGWHTVLHNAVHPPCVSCHSHVLEKGCINWRGINKKWYAHQE